MNEYQPPIQLDYVRVLIDDFIMLKSLRLSHPLRSQERRLVI